MHRSKVERIAVAWREARMKACAAPMGDKGVWINLGTAETDLSEAVADLLDWEAEAAKLAARPKLFVVHGKMYFADHEEEACTLEEAIELAAYARDNNAWCPKGVRTFKGEVVLTQSQIDEKILEFWN